MKRARGNWTQRTTIKYAHVKKGKQNKWNNEYGRLARVPSPDTTIANKYFTCDPPSPSFINSTFNTKAKTIIDVGK